MCNVGGMYADDVTVEVGAGVEGMEGGKRVWVPTVPGKKRGAAKYNTKYNQSWEKIYGFVTRSFISNEHIFCTVCQKDVSIAHGGANDIDRHAKGQWHNKRLVTMVDLATGGCCVEHNQAFDKVGIEIVVCAHCFGSECIVVCNVH